ncbi:beta-galactosidase-1-like protein 2 [Leptinotarsa decemlineata]|uniref:beta-galactosidase-1-like protein 2 n=1 Tax=Leptinotarsa decemlineata TaxID=7539 RepID=UPI003D30761F
MMIPVVLLFSAFTLSSAKVLNVTADLPTNYEYYEAGGVESGLTDNKPNFYLNGKEIFIYSGAFHYFRVHKTYWRDRLRKMRAAGLNTVETYIPWNLHEPRSGEYDFGNGNNDMSNFLHLQEFLKTAREEDLFVIIRSGPFICAEFEFGGLPSWLLRENNIEIRTSNAAYMKHVTKYFNVLMPILAPHQFTEGGPIIMFQVENEYSISGKHDLKYLQLLRNLMISKGIKELLVTADNPDKETYGTLPDLFLMTGNFDKNPKTQLNILKSIQPNRPTMTMEYWGGWFDFWGNSHTKKTLEEFRYNYEEILRYPASVNIYMFVGGTNFGFLNGAQNLKYDDENTDFHSITSSYDYLSPLDESGDYTDKYWAAKELLAKYNRVHTKLPDVPSAPKKIAYGSVEMEKQIFLYYMLQSIKPVHSTNPIAMEKLDINNGNGQSYGYIVYRKTNLDIPANGILEIEGRVCDTVMVLVNGILVSPWLEKSSDLKNAFGTSMTKNSKLTLTDKHLQGATLDIIVENWGRVNVGVYKQFKGIWQGGMKLNGNYLRDWTIYPLEFTKSWTNSLTQWSSILEDSKGPSLYRGTLEIKGTPEDTFIHMESWVKGIVIVNGFVLGRYARMGPVQTLYLPAPLLQSGKNDILVFEHFQPFRSVDFVKNHIYKSY